MSDNKNLRGGRDRDRISLEQDYEVRHWTRKLGVTRQELEEAVKSVGHSAEKVRQHLAARKGGAGGMGGDGAAGD